MTASKLLDRPELSRKRYLDPQAMVEGINGHIRSLEGKFQLQSTAGYLKLVVRNVEQAVHAKENGNFFAVHSAQFPIEFFWPLGIMPLFHELQSAVAGIIGNDSRQSPSISDDIGFPCRSCSCYRTFHGMVETGAWPVPDFVVYASSPCDPVSNGQEMTAGCMKVPCFGLDRPCRIVTPQSMKYWLGEHHALIRFLEEQTGRRMDYDQLEDVARLSYRATQAYLEINELRSAIPCPMPAEAAFAPMTVYRAWAGTQTCVDFLEALRDELKGRVARGVGAVPLERIRYAYATSRPFFDLGIMAEAETRFGAVNVMDHLQWWRADTDWLLEPDDSVASFAHRDRFGPCKSLQGTAMDHAEELRQAALKCKADGIVYFDNVGCRHAAASRRISRDAIERSLGLPCAVIDCGTLDGSLTTFDEVMDQLGVFFAKVERSKPRQKRIRPRGRPRQAGRGTA